MILSTSQNWIEYIRHVLESEGETSKDPNDSAAKCVPTGKIHTNKGVTYCTYKDKAEKLGLNPSYESFLKLTDADAAKFLYVYYMAVNGQEFADSLALALTESAWMSGTARAYEHLKKALENLGQTANTRGELIAKAKILPDRLIFDEFTKVRRQYLEKLLSLPKYKNYKGWLTRLKNFYDKFNPLTLAGKKKYLVLAGFLILLLIFKNLKK